MQRKYDNRNVNCCVCVCVWFKALGLGTAHQLLGPKCLSDMMPGERDF